MPELPEVETIARQLAPLITGRTIKSLKIIDEKLDPDRPRRIHGQTIKRIYRREKFLVLELAKKTGQAIELLLAVHLRMTGRLLWYPDRGPVGAKHLRAIIQLDQGSLHFVDIRRFGKLIVCDSGKLPTSGGVEPFAKEFTPAKLRQLLGQSRQEIKPWLLRQDKIAGLGNIYASETLHAAGISPFREAGSLNRDEIKKLHTAIRRILTKAIAMSGTTFSDFQDARGKSGAFARMLKVYGRRDELCLSCKTPLIKIKQQGRSSFYCPDCQG